MGRHSTITDEDLLDAIRPHVDDNGIARVRLRDLAAKLNVSYGVVDQRVVLCPRIVRLSYNTYRVYDSGCERCGGPRDATQVVRFGSETHSELCWPCIQKILYWIRAGNRKAGTSK